MTTNVFPKRVDRLPAMFEDFFKPWDEFFDTRWGKMATIPAVNIIDTMDEYKLWFAVPGLKKEDFVIDVDGNILTISCEKEENIEEKELKFTRKEFSYTSFSRSFTLPEEVNREKIEALYKDGVLTLVLPKKEDVKKIAATKHIAVK